MSNIENNDKDDENFNVKTEASEVDIVETETDRTETVEMESTETAAIEEEIMDPVPNEQSIITEDTVNKALSATVAASVIQGLGHQLKTARIAQGMSIGDVSRQLRLSVKQIEAIEKEDFEKLPSRTFLRGFVRNYANLVRLDPAPILQLLPPVLSSSSSLNTAYQPEATSFPSKWQWSRRENGYGYGRRRGLSLKAVLIVLFLLIIYGVYRSIDWGQISILNSKNNADISLETAVNGQTSMVLPLPLSSLPRPPAMSSGNQSAATISNAQGILHFKFKDESWVEIRDNSNKLIFKQLNAGGTEQVVSGKRPLTLVIGKADSVNLTYNDRLIDLVPYTNKSEGIARLTLE